MVVSAKSMAARLLQSLMTGSHDVVRAPLAHTNSPSLTYFSCIQETKKLYLATTLTARSCTTMISVCGYTNMYRRLLVRFICKQHSSR